ncbi:M48 family metalloprotease [Parerythrobacter aestuarii]|uniref:hypothetical protein n=1 Tax=Parerythrobacter aestuarii TaxID=3020909 RepID=UPI0024DEB29C|nr:hypothetical protein [Parerythrobacter aestuarii]
MRAKWLGCAALLWAAGASAAAVLPEAFVELRAKDARVARIGYELVTGNAAFCDQQTPATGLLLHDLAAYGDGEKLGRLLGMTSPVGIQAVVPGSPADQSGLAADQSIASLAGLDVAGMPTDEKKRWKRLETIRVAMVEQLQTERKLAFQAVGGESLVIEAIPACASRFEVGPLGKRAVADGSRVVIGEDFPGHEWSDELLAGVMAHELAHNVLRHRAWLDAKGRKRKNVRLTEREADRLAPWLLANAGYDPEAAVRFMATWGPDHSGGIFRKRTHDGWDERVEFIAAEVPLVRAQMAATGTADWRSNFRREIKPQG